MHTYIQRQNQQVNHRHIKITYLLTAPEPARGYIHHVISSRQPRHVFTCTTDHCNERRQASNVVTWKRSWRTVWCYASRENFLQL